jgi:hypothetical protein
MIGRHDDGACRDMTRHRRAIVKGVVFCDLPAEQGQVLPFARQLGPISVYQGL